MKQLIDRINQIPLFKLVTSCFLLFLVIYSPRLKAIYVTYLVFAALAYVLIDKAFYKKPYFWLIVLGLLIPRLYASFLFIGNHYFVMIYLILIFMIVAFYKTNSEKILSHNATVLLVLIMSFAVLQKLLVPDYLNGTSLAFLGYSGNIFKYIFYFNEDYRNIFHENAVKMSELYQHPISQNPRIQLQPIFKKFPQVIIWFSYMTLIAEILFVVALFVKNQWIKHGFIIFFLLSLLVTREETGFLSMLCILLMMHLGKQNTYYRAAYLGIFILCISLIIVGKGEL
ncbi:MAG: hypothetical protein ABR595_02480 [Psychroflexus sp.]